MSLARALRRSALLVRLRRAQWAASCAIVLALGALLLASLPASEPLASSLASERAHAPGPLVLEWPSASLALESLCSIAVGAAALIAFSWPVDRLALARALDRANMLEGRVVAALEFASARTRTPFMDAALRDVEARALAVRGVLPRLPPWLRVLAFAPWVAVALCLALREGRPPRPAVQRAPRAVAGAPAARVDALAEVAALEAELTALEAQRAARELAQLRALEPLRTALVAARTSAREQSDARGASALLRALADALTTPELSPARRAQLQEALERARTHEQARLAAARAAAQARRSTPREPAPLARLAADDDAATSAAQRPPDGLPRAPAAHQEDPPQLAQPRDEERQLAQLTRPRREEREGEQPLRAGERGDDDRLAGAGAQPEQRAAAQDHERGAGTRGDARQGEADARAADERRARLERALRAGEREQEQLAQQLTRAAEALARGADAEAARALRDGAHALDRQPYSPRDGGDALDRERANGEQASAPAQRADLPVQAATVQRVAGGGSEPDRGDHAPAERRIGGSYQDVRVRGVHGEGPSRSQVIEGASQAGFASLPYRRVYADYRAHAEQLLERDDVPASERIYVRRYFQLVEPP